MITLTVIVDDVLSPSPHGVARYAEDLTRALIATAPPSCTVEGFVASSTEAEYEDLLDRLPGITLHKSGLARRELSAAWQHGFTRLSGMVHAPSLLAPLAKHDRVNNPGQQTVVTLHDTIPWDDAESVEGRSAAWHIAMARRAHRYADALVVPSHAVAAQLGEHLDFGDRVRVVGGAVSSTLSLPANADSRAERLALPQTYVLAIGGLAGRRGLSSVLAALSRAETNEVPLVVVGTAESEAILAAAAEAGLDASRIHVLGELSDADLSVVYDRAAALVQPSQLEGFGFPLLEAMHFGTPVIHSDTPALVELAGSAGLEIALDDPEELPERIAAAIATVLTDDAERDRLRQAGIDRAGLYSWESSAEKIWQLHADL